MLYLLVLVFDMLYAWLKPAAIGCAARHHRTSKQKHGAPLVGEQCETERAASVTARVWVQ